MTHNRRLPVVAVTLLSLGSGLLNLYSVINPGLPERVHLLRKIFPLEFVHLSRSATLLIGFTLVVASFNIYRRKRLAFWVVAVLGFFSVMFHLTKGVDYEEALLSLALLISLFLARHSFTVRSRRPNWRGALERVIAAFALAIAYGMAGFWLIEPRQFGIDFNWYQALHHTIEFLTLQGDPSLQPHTHYAAWFLDSLYLMTSAAFLYSLYAVFRPVLYQFRTHPLEIERARRILEQHGRSSQDFFKARADKSYFFSEDERCFLAYRVGRSFAVVLGDPVGPAETIGPIVREFTRFCQDNGWGIAFHQALPDFLDVYQELGFKKLKVGDDAVVDLPQFTLDGKAAKTFRSKVNQLEKDGIHTRYYEPPIAPELMAQIREVSDEWLQIPGRRERRFALGIFDEEYLGSTPIFTAEDSAGRVLAFVNLVPSYRKGEATIDLMRRRTEAPNGIMDYVFVKLFLRVKGESFERFNLGMAPMAGFQNQEEAGPEERAIHAFFQHLNFLFSYKGLLAYKSKFATIWEPRYLIYRNILDLPRVAMAISTVSEVDDD
ncbi:MAG: phosphatidylglycerol lysyltransferase domain-containing protein [Bryobacteraceae bacterium]